MGILRSQTDVRSLKAAGKITSDVLSALCETAKPGVSTVDLENLANRLLAQNRSSAPFKGFEGFNQAICISLNEEIVNGPPLRERILKVGDVVSIAMASEQRGIHAKAARTIYLGEHPPEDITRLLAGTAAVIPAALVASRNVQMLNQLLELIPSTAGQYGLTVIQGLGGEGIGKKLHEWPPVPNEPAALEETIPLTPGLAFTLMPMFSLGEAVGLDTHEDGWTYLTRDRAIAAHFADTLLMTDEGLLNITAPN